MKQKTMSRIIRSISVAVALSFPVVALAQTSGWNLGNLTGFGLPRGFIFGIVENILYWLLGILGIVGIIGFVIAGILYLLSAGEETRMETAKKAMMYSIIGVIVGLGGYVIIQAAFWALSGFSNF